MDLVLKLSRPVQDIFVGLDKYYLVLENADLLHGFYVVLWHVDDLMVEVLVVLMTLYYTNLGFYLIWV